MDETKEYHDLEEHFENLSDIEKAMTIFTYNQIIDFEIESNGYDDWEF